MDRFRIYDLNGKWSKRPCKGYFAGWIDDYREAKQMLKHLREELKGDFEVHKFKGEKLLNFKNNQHE